MPMLDSVKTAFKLPDLRKKIFFTVGMLFLFRLGAHIPVPGFKPISSLGEAGNLFNLLDILSGGALRKMSLFALSVNPYITASIIMQLLTMVIPALERMQREGVEGRRKITQYMRYGAILLAVVQGWAYTVNFSEYLISDSLWNIAQIIIVMTAGSMLLMWIGELIAEYGLGNGISLIIFAGIVARFWPGAIQFVRSIGSGGIDWYMAVLYAAGAVAIVALVVAVNEGQRRIPVQYAKRVVGRRMYGGQTTHIPLRVNQAGVIPIIFAVSVLSFPPTLAGFFPEVGFIRAIQKLFLPSSWVYMAAYAIMVFLFTFFYTAATFNPIEVSNNLKKYSGFIPGIRPGKPTSDYLDKILTRITFAGGVFLTFVALLPNMVTRFFNMSAGFSGTALLIAVGVAIDTMRQIESHLIMRQYEGFLK
ncbi:MAG: preprotein translocase subunit SecY [Patescibacteria group bacterium]